MKSTYWHQLLIIVVLAIPGSAFGWGHDGHKMVGDVATPFLSSEASTQIAALLANDLDANGKPSDRKTLGDIASWPDEIRAKKIGQGKAPWHFDDKPVCGNAPKTQWCPSGVCASEQIVRMFSVLRDTQAKPQDRNEALKWIVHLVGDIHQPLHSADNGDRGGNNITVSVPGSGGGHLNLHSIWDTLMVQQLISDKGLSAADLASSISTSDQTSWSKGTVTDWVDESNQLALNVAYGKLTGGFSCGGTVVAQTVPIDQGYLDASELVITEQIKKAGFRLAGILNAAFQASSVNVANVAVPVATSPPTDAPLHSVAVAARASHLPDSAKTPGRASYHTAESLCAMGSTKDERFVPNSAKLKVYSNYGVGICQGYCSGPQGCEIDHLISLELGGANTEDNLWPQPYDGEWNAHDKDKLENKLHRMVCVEKTISLDAAQQEISTDWIAAYQKYIGARKPFKPINRCK